MYYVDKQWIDSLYKDTSYSYEVGPFDNKYFETKEQAEAYAKENEWELGKNEVFEIMEVEE